MINALLPLMKIPTVVLGFILAWNFPPSVHAAPASFSYVLQADSLDKNKPASVSQLAACKRDWIVLDLSYNTERPWKREDLHAIRSAQDGRKIIAYISIGEAEEYRSYWHKEWSDKGRPTDAAPSWLGVENPEWKGNYRVKYWNSEWQNLILASIDEAMARGFDGVYLDIVDAFETWEQNGEDYIDDRINPETKQSFRRDMVDWVKAIAVRARIKNPAALVIPQNGSQLLAHADFLAAISAIGIEDLFTNGNKLQSKSHTNEVLHHLQKMRDAQKPILLIEYPTNPVQQALSHKSAHKHGMTLLITDRPLKTLGISDS